MSTTLKRVALDFDWPIDKVWEGYLNGHASNTETCSLCKGSGDSPFAKVLNDKWYGYVDFHPKETGSTPFLPTDQAMIDHVTRKINRTPETYAFYETAVEWKSDPFQAISAGGAYHSSIERFETNWGVQVDREQLDSMDPVVVTEAIRMCNLVNSQFMHHLTQKDVDILAEEGRLRDFTHDLVPDQGWTEKSPKVSPTAAAVNAWSFNGFGHDSMNNHIVVTERCKRAGQPVMCAGCEGEGETASEETKALIEAWRPTEPPVGDGYQLWETVSEGSPISPVFETPGELAKWLADNESHIKLSVEEWVKVIGAEGASMSMVITGGKLMSGEEAVAKAK